MKLEEMEVLLAPKRKERSQETMNKQRNAF